MTKTMADDAKIEVTQADRNAAAENWRQRQLIAHGWVQQVVADIRAGKNDEDCEVQAFARHRIASTAALQAELQALRAGLTPFADLGAGSKASAPRHFVQLLVCPEGDDDPRDWRPKIATARALLARTQGEQTA